MDNQRGRERLLEGLWGRQAYRELSRRSFAVSGSAQTDSERLSQLNSIATVGEYDVDQDGNYRWTLWEWE